MWLIRLVVYWFIGFLGCGQEVQAQRTLSTSGAVIKFVSTRNGDVSATNSNVTATIGEAGVISFKLLVRGFKFAMGEMEEHFNKEYMESDKYPEASFKGMIVGVKRIDFNKTAQYKVQATGDMMLHNVTKRITVGGTLHVDKGVVSLRAKFPLNIADYGIETGLGGVIIGSKMEVEVNATCR